jgi:hypothetical protein
MRYGWIVDAAVIATFLLVLILFLKATNIV